VPAAPPGPQRSGLRRVSVGCAAPARIPVLRATAGSRRRPAAVAGPVVARRRRPARCVPPPRGLRTRLAASCRRDASSNWAGPSSTKANANDAPAVRLGLRPRPSRWALIFRNRLTDQRRLVHPCIATRVEFATCAAIHGRSAPDATGNRIITVAAPAFPATMDLCHDPQASPLWTLRPTTRRKPPVAGTRPVLRQAIAQPYLTSDRLRRDGSGRPVHRALQVRPECWTSP
jgi:hypothetical protein